MFSLFRAKEPEKSGDDDLDFLLGLADPDPEQIAAGAAQTRKDAAALVEDNTAPDGRVPLLDIGHVSANPGTHLKYIKKKGSATSRAAERVAERAEAAADGAFAPLQPQTARDHLPSSGLPDFLRQKRGVAKSAAIAHHKKVASSKPRESKEVEHFIKKFKGIPGVITSPRQLELAGNRKYDESTGLFSSYEVSAARDSRKDTYLIQHLQKKMSSMRDAELAREAGEKSRQARLRALRAKEAEQRSLGPKRRQDMSEWLSLKYKVLEATSAEELQASLARHRIAGDDYDKLNSSNVSSNAEAEVKPESSVERRMQLVKAYDRVNRERFRAMQARKAREVERRRLKGGPEEGDREAAAAAAAAEAAEVAEARKRRIVNNKRRTLRDRSAAQQQEAPHPPSLHRRSRPEEEREESAEWEFYAEPDNRWSLSDVPINRDVIQSPPQSATAGSDLCSDRVERAQVNTGYASAAAGGGYGDTDDTYSEEEFVKIDLDRTYDSESDSESGSDEGEAGEAGEAGEPTFFTHPAVAQMMRRAQTDRLYSDWDADASQPYLHRDLDEPDALEVSGASFNSYGGGLVAENAVTFYDEGQVVAGALRTCD